MPDSVTNPDSVEVTNDDSLIAGFTAAMDDEEEGDETDPEQDKSDAAEEEESPSEGEEADEEQGDAKAEPDAFEVEIDGQKAKVNRNELIAGYQRQADYTRKTQALADERKGIEAERAKLKERLDQYAKPETQAQILTDRALVENAKTVDWTAMAIADQKNGTNDYVVYKSAVDAAQQRLAKLEADHKDASEAVTKESEAKRREYANREWAALAKAVPVLNDKDAGKRKAAFESMKAAAHKHGITDDELKEAFDHRFWLIAHDAAQWQKLQADKAKAGDKKVATKTKPITPGVSKGAKPSDKRALNAKLKNSKNVDAQVEALLAEFKAPED